MKRTTGKQVLCGSREPSINPDLNCLSVLFITSLPNHPISQPPLVSAKDYSVLCLTEIVQTTSIFYLPTERKQLFPIIDGHNSQQLVFRQQVVNPQGKV